MSIIRQVAQLKSNGQSIRSISDSLGISRNTVRKYLRLFQGQGLSLAAVVQMESGELSELIDPSGGADSDRYLTLLKLFPSYERELGRVGVTRGLLWGEYKAQYPGGYNYSRFCYHFQQWLNQKQVVMHFDHKAGDKLFIDYTGKKIEVVDPDSGEIQEAEIFVAILGASQLTYVEALPSQQLQDFIRATCNALAFFRGVPQVLVPDNLKSAVTRSNKYEALLNESFADMALHYETSILPARSRKPRDKALVENAVKLVYTRVFAPLRNDSFTSLGQLNAAIKPLLKRHNELPFQGEKYSRQDRFEEIEKQALKPLPSEPYELKSFAKAKVQKNAHVLLGADKHYYSVPYAHTGKQVKLIYTSSTVEIYYKHQRIASHKRNRRRNTYTTVKDHMPSTHQFIADWNPEKFLKWAGNIGPHTQDYVDQILKQKTYPEQAYRACLGILSFAKKTAVGKERLELACKRGSYFQSYGYHIIKRILDHKLEQIETDPPAQLKLPLHDNIRGENYYQ